MDQKQNQELRSVILNRVKNDKKGKLPDERLYQPYEGAPEANIALLTQSLEGVYDIVLLHDPIDGCLMLNLQENIEKKLTKFPCKLHNQI